jgi:hypothetical protein
MAHLDSTATLMTSYRPDPLDPRRSNARHWRLGAVACWLATALWLLGSWAVVSGAWAIGYEVDIAATLLCALLLLLAGLLTAWRGWQLGLDEAQASHKQWLSILLVRRDEAEQAAEAIESLCDALEDLQRAWQPVTGQRPPSSAPDVPRLDHISPALQPVLARQPGLTQQLQSLQARLVNVQVKFGRGDPLDALAYDLHPLSDEYRQLESALSQLFSELQSIEEQRADHLQQYQAQLDSQDPYAPWRTRLQAALTQVEQARALLARSLDQDPPLRPTHLDEFLGLRP